MNFIRKIRENLKNPRTRSFTLLALYAIFFIIVFILLSGGESINKNYIPPKEEKNDYNYNYNYTYKIFDKDSYVYIGENDNNYNYEIIEKIIQNSDSETKYKNSTKVLYNINALKYFEILDDVSNCDNINCKDIYILITEEKYENNNYVTIDLANYYGYKYNIEIEYYVAVKD